MDRGVQVYQFLPLVLFGRKSPWHLWDPGDQVIQVDQEDQEDQEGRQYHCLLLDPMFLMDQEDLCHPFLPVHLWGL